ncbi:MAG TPA: filamentous hemagglutinin, partial [Candidatus Moranbacteria bacterium]|nr:filamentous hemagglutinin [Candidatus Moranbacteria bacterium]
TVSISAFTATDTVGVTGYKLTESATAPEAGAAGWTETAPTSYTFTNEGSNTLYAWVKDAAGNV